MIETNAKETKRRLIGELADIHFSTMRLIADTCEEMGQSEEAAGWRWLADNKRWPSSRSRRGHPVLYGFSFRRDEDFFDFGTKLNGVRIKSKYEHELPNSIYHRFYTWERKLEESIDQVLRTTAVAVGKWLAEEAIRKEAQRKLEEAKAVS
jgi:hypothetical protein